MPANLFNPRISVELKGSSQPWNCCTEQIIEVTRACYPLKNEEIITLVNLAGFSGQEEKVIGNTTQPLDACNKRYVYTVRVLCDSGD